MVSFFFWNTLYICVLSYSEPSLIDKNGATSELANLGFVHGIVHVSILVGLEAKSLLKSFVWK